MGRVEKQKGSLDVEILYLVSKNENVGGNLNLLGESYID